MTQRQKKCISVSLQHEPHSSDAALGKAALCQAFLDAEGNARRDGTADTVNVFAGDALSKGGSNHIVAHGEGSVEGLEGAKVFVCE
ncbi:hypothetical protein BN1723_003243 [Verticillium longisporum]|uniref:Uncharacterized protein n=1 Tax=Verticillium longisporum TaxID=100787 RepID=A0A0G4LUT7_VERLO|nr:hypothetical protein BN1723_003243 [Verticillium longisporum]